MKVKICRQGMVVRAEGEMAVSPRRCSATAPGEPIPAAPEGRRPPLPARDSPGYRYLPVRRLLELLPDGCPQVMLVVADDVRFSSGDHGLLVLDLAEERGRTFRAVPGAIRSIINNLWWSANMDFRDYINSVDDTGVFRLSDRYFAALAALRGASQTTEDKPPG